MGKLRRELPSRQKADMVLISFSLAQPILQVDPFIGGGPARVAIPEVAFYGYLSTLPCVITPLSRQVGGFSEVP